MAVAAVPSATSAYAANRDTTRETADRFRDDQVLRQYGFEIHARPGGGPAVWRRRGDGRLFTDAEARRVVAVARAGELKSLERN